MVCAGVFLMEPGIITGGTPVPQRKRMEELREGFCCLFKGYTNFEAKS
jgi:hypothetical protein